MTENDLYEAIPRRTYGKEMEGVTIHSRETPTLKAKFAMAMIERWAMVQGKDDGEDSAGRAKIGLMPVDDVVARALDLSDKAIDSMRKRGWMVDVPSWEDLKQQAMLESNEP